MEYTREQILLAEQQGFKLLPDGRVHVAQKPQNDARELIQKRFLERTAYLVREDCLEQADIEFRKMAIEEAIPFLEKLIKDKKAKDVDRLKAAITILNRAFGTPKETIEVNSISLKVDI
jgi:hypothetical protein